MRSEKEYFRDYEKRFHDALAVAQEGMGGYTDLPPSPPFRRSVKRNPVGLRSFTISKTLNFKDHFEEADCQMAASDVRNIEPVS